MKILIPLVLIVINISSYGQDCPNRIGDLILNETTINNIPKVCSYCTNYGEFRKIESGTQFQIYEVSDDDFDTEYTAENGVYELIPDLKDVGGWYTRDYANVNDSVRVLFIPGYETNGISVKNVLLKFYDDTLFYIKANLSKSYREILFEKYKGKSFRTAEKKTKNSCSNIKFKKYLNSYSEYYFSNKVDTTTFAKIIFDFKINKDCKVWNDDRIEIFNMTKTLKELVGRQEDMIRVVSEIKARKETEKKQTLEKF